MRIQNLISLQIKLLMHKNEAFLQEAKHSCPNYISAYTYILRAYNLSHSGEGESLPYENFVDAANIVERNQNDTVHVDVLRKDDFG